MQPIILHFDAIINVQNEHISQREWLKVLPI